MTSSPFLIQNYDFKGSRATVVGLGRFGGSIAAIEYLADQGAQITVIDVNDEDSLSESRDRLASYPEIRFEFEYLKTELPKSDFVVVNPAIPPNHSLIKSAREQRIPITSEIELFWQLNRGKVIGVTGSNGKSTTTAMIHSIMETSGTKCWLGGNIGISLLPVVDQIQAEDWVILELSSFQLEALNRIRASPHVGVVTNFSPNHLDWHQTVEHYRHCKQTLFRWQSQHDYAILNTDDLDSSSWTTTGIQFTFGTAQQATPNVLVNQSEFQIIDQREVLEPRLNVPGMHNRMNAAAAISACYSVGINMSKIQQGLEAFQGLPHRLQFIGEFQGRHFFNDSLATTPESAICALDAFEDSSVILMAGGSDKQVDLTAFANRLLEGTKATALMGETGPIIADLLENQIANETTLSQISPPQNTFEAAFTWAYRQSDRGDIILLSPGCASYGWFSSFVERGEMFCELFHHLAGQSNVST